MDDRWDETDLRRLGYEEGPDGVFRKKVRNHVRDKNSGTLPKPKPNKRDEQKRSNETEKGGASESKKGSRKDRFVLAVTSYRTRDMDPDNLVPKWYIDELVKAEIIPDDSSKYIEGIFKSVVPGAEEEYTTIKVYKLK